MAIPFTPAYKQQTVLRASLRHDRLFSKTQQQCQVADLLNDNQSSVQPCSALRTRLENAHPTLQSEGITVAKKSRAANLGIKS